MKLRLIVSSLILFVIALGFNVTFTLTSLDKLYIESIISQYRVIGKDLQRSLERGIRYGKSLNNFFGIEQLLTATKDNISDKINKSTADSTAPEMKFQKTDVSLCVTSPDGTILYGDSNHFTTRRLPQMALPNQHKTSNAKHKASASNYFKHQDTFITTLPVRDSQKNLTGIIAISFRESQIEAFLEDVFEKSIWPIITISLSGIVSLMLFLYFFTPNDRTIQKFSKKRISLFIFVVIGSAQILTSGLSTTAFKNHLLKLNKENTETLNAMLQRDVESLLEQGAHLDKMIKLDGFLSEIIAASPEIKDITLFDHNRQPLYRATKSRVTDFQRSKDCYDEWVQAIKPIENPDFNFQINLKNQDRMRGFFSTNMSKDILYKKIFDTAMDSFTVIIISILFFVEVLILFFKYLERQVPGTAHETVIHYGVMRPAAFLFLFGIDISISFIPLHMEALYRPIFNLSRDTIMGLPISIEFMFVGIAILISGIWLDRRGWHEPFLSGLVLAGLGILYSWLAPDALHFIISRAVVGLGYGLSLMAAQGFVITYSDWQSKAQGLAHLFAGIYAGSICGGATGAMLAEWMGYSPVFLIGAFIMFAVVMYTLVFMRSGMRKPEFPASTGAKTSMKGNRVFNFLSSRTIIGLILFSSLPAAIAVVGFLNYFSPVYLNRMGASQSTIGQILMIYGICLIYFGPFISRYVDASRHKKLYIFLGCALGSVALLTFYILEGITAAAVAVLLLGLSSSFVLASQSAFALKLSVTQELGEGKAIGIFRSTSRVGQMLGPIAFSSIIVATNIQTGITYLGLIYLLTAILFIVFTQRDHKTVLLEDI